MEIGIVRRRRLWLDIDDRGMRLKSIGEHVVQDTSARS